MMSNQNNDFSEWSRVIDKFASYGVAEDNAIEIMTDFPIKFVKSKLTQIINSHKKKPKENLPGYIISVFKKTTQEQADKENEIELRYNPQTDEISNLTYEERYQMAQKDRQQKEQALFDSATNQDIADFVQYAEKEEPGTFTMFNQYGLEFIPVKDRFISFLRRQRSKKW